MALSVAVGSFAKSTGASPASQAVTGVGFQPKALILWCTRLTAAGFGAHAAMAFGFTDGTNSRAISGSARDNLGTEVVNAEMASKVLTMRFMPGAISLIEFECDLTSFDADGFTLSWTTNTASAVIINWLAIGGADLTNVKAGNFDGSNSTGSQAITGVGFQPDALILMQIGANGSLPINSAGFWRNSIAVMTGSGETTSIFQGSADNAGVSSTARVYRNDGAVIFGATDKAGTWQQDYEATFTSFDSDGFTIQWGDAGSPTVAYLALKGGQYQVGEDAQKASTGTDAETGVGFTPKGLLFLHANTATANTLLDHNRTGIGAASAAGTERHAWAGDTDAANTTSADSHQSTTKDKVMVDADAPGAVAAEADLSSFDSDGFTEDWTTADATARLFSYLAIGDAVAAATGVQFGQVI